MQEKSTMTKEDRITKLRFYLNIMKSDGRDYSKLENYLLSSSYLDDPASTKYHGAYEGGLFEHSLGVSEALNMLTEKLGLRWQFNTSPLLIGLCHDLCKVGSYKITEDTKDKEPKDRKYTYSDAHPLGHGEKSVMILLRLFPELTEEEQYCIRWHMGAYVGNQDWGNIDSSIKKYKNVYWTHVADMMESHGLLKKVDKNGENI